MSALIKTMPGYVSIALTSVSAPGYTLQVSNYSVPGHVQDGWYFVSDEPTPESFADPWVQPQGAHDAYALGAIVSHSGARWRSLITANVWVPGVSGWANADSDIPAWIQPTGAHDAYSTDAIVRHNGDIWISLIDANVWAPGVSGWRQMAVVPPSGVPTLPPWVQPTGGHDAYPLGARVSHAGQNWTSTVAANVWEPGVYGWVAD